MMQEGKVVVLTDDGKWAVAPIGNDEIRAWTRMSAMIEVEALEMRLEMLEAEGLDHHSEEWQETFDAKERLLGMVASLKKKEVP